MSDSRMGPVHEDAVVHPIHFIRKSNLQNNGNARASLGPWLLWDHGSQARSLLDARYLEQERVRPTRPEVLGAKE